MKTDIEYLRTLDRDLQQVASREKGRQAAPPVRRGRSWGGWGTVAAGVIGFLVIAGIIGMFATNDRLASSADDAGQAASSTPAGNERQLGPVAGASGAAGVARPSIGQGLAAVTGEQGTDISKIIRDGSMSIQVPKDDFSKGFAAATRIAQNHGGFVLSSQTRGQRRGTLVLRIPAKRFDDAMVALRAIGVVQAHPSPVKTSPRSTSTSRRGWRTRSASGPCCGT